MVVFEFEVWNVVEGDAHGGGFGAELGLHGVGVVEGASAVGFVDAIHDALEGDALGLVFLWE